ncbi:MAG TPA: hypothetical protein VII58_00890 [Acidobacteriaceae bacterium]
MSDLAKAFAGLKQAQEPERLGTQARRSGTTPDLRGRVGPRLAPLPLQGTAKSRHPEYTPVKVFLRRETHKAAGRKWEDQDAGDFSDLVEELLQKYLSA